VPNSSNIISATRKVLRKGAKKAGLKVFGGVNAPYIWVRTPKGVTSWQAFDKI
jgi:LL-diaminopimelate aminotransferase